MSKKFIAGALSLALAGSVLAQSKLPDEGYYAYAEAGGATQHTSAGWNNDTRNRWAIGGGYDFNKYVGLELGIVTMSNIRMGIDVPGGTAYAEEKQKLAWNWNVVGGLPINDSLKAIAMVGQMRVKGRYAQWGPAVVNEDSGYVPIKFNNYGVGGELAFDRRTSLRVYYWRSGSIKDASGATSFYNTGVTGGIKVKF